MINIGEKVYFANYPYDNTRQRWNGFEPVGIFECIVEEMTDIDRYDGTKKIMYKVIDVNTNEIFWAPEEYIFLVKDETRENIERKMSNTFIADMQRYFNEMQAALGNMLDAGIKVEKYMQEMEDANEKTN